MDKSNRRLESEILDDATMKYRHNRFREKCMIAENFD
jgi:hypothetical protein